MNFFNKLKLFSGIELFYVVLTSVAKKTAAHKLLKKIPPELMSLQGLLVALDRQKVVVKKYRELIFFDFLINDRNFKVYLKRNSSDANVFKGVILAHDYRGVISLMEKHHIPGKVMIDAGANIGLTSIYFKAHFPDLKVISLEPAHNTFGRFKKNIDENKLTDVHLLEKGLWSYKTLLFEDRTFRDKQDWSFRLAANKSEGETEIETVSVHDLIHDFKIDLIDVLKIDIEGAEAEVFNTQSNLDWLNKVRLICIEIHDEFNCRESIEGLLVKYGFALSHSGELTIGVNRILKLESKSI